MADTIDPKLVDKRIYERLVASGHLDEKAYDRHVKGLPDLADKALSVSTVMGTDDDFDDADDADELDETSDAVAPISTPEGGPQA